jgi:UDP-N-acetylmuramate--alanine ligase
MELIPNKHIHFIGIGGVGMSAIAQVLLEKGLRISGSDKRENIFTIRLASLGAKVYVGHQASHVRGAEAVVYSAAVRPDNPEIKYARKNQMPVIPRARMLSQVLSESQRSIAITGTHGKTTTSAMITSILCFAGHKPTFMVGGELCDLGTNAGLGDGNFAVAEADESDASFLELKPHVEVITNMEMEHCDFYPSMEDIFKSYASFTDCLLPAGRLILQGDHANAQTFIKRLGGRASLLGGA